MRHLAASIPVRRLLAGAAVLTVVVLAGAGRVGAQAQGGGWQIPEGGRDEKSPLAGSPDVIKRGKSVFTSYCQRCHGPRGKGDGPDGDADTPPADLTDASRAAANPDGVVFYKVWNGRKSPQMPAFKSRLTKDEAWAAVQYVKTLRGQP